MTLYYHSYAMLATISLFVYFLHYHSYLQVHFQCFLYFFLLLFCTMKTQHEAGPFLCMDEQLSTITHNVERCGY